jgi:hypothetical protein
VPGTPRAWPAAQPSQTHASPRRTCSPKQQQFFSYKIHVVHATTRVHSIFLTPNEAIKS